MMKKGSLLMLTAVLWKKPITDAVLAKRKALGHRGGGSRKPEGDIKKCFRPPRLRVRRFLICLSSPRGRAYGIGRRRSGRGDRCCAPRSEERRVGKEWGS